MLTVDVLKRKEYIFLKVRFSDMVCVQHKLAKPAFFNYKQAKIPHQAGISLCENKIRLRVCKLIDVS